MPALSGGTRWHRASSTTADATPVLIVTDPPQEAAAELAPDFDLTAEQVLASSESAFGSVDQIVEQLLARREWHGISDLTVVQPQMEAFAPVVSHLAGT